jgi:hypothetical protein
VKNRFQISPFRCNLQTYNSVHVGRQEVVPELYTKAVHYASEAMDILEFRLSTRMRDGRSGENPVSSLFELTAVGLCTLNII